jgi:hypothetical protein
LFSKTSLEHGLNLEGKKEKARPCFLKKEWGLFLPGRSSDHEGESDADLSFLDLPLIFSFIVALLDLKDFEKLIKNSIS